jgi:succinate dehydrogenase/fumarate reductase flavoprotein subunit
MLFEDYLKTGRGPVYMDCRGISDEDYKYFIYFMKHEGLESFLNYLDEEGIDLRKNPVEFTRYEIRLNGGIYYNEKSETSVAGLYAAGDELFGGIANAAIFGWIAGENAAEYASRQVPPELDRLKGFIDEKKEYVNEIRRRETGTDWKDANMALQQTMNDYAGTIRSDTMLEAGLAHLRRLKSKARALLTCRNQWELVRCLEVLNLFDLGELVFIAARERKETRGRHMRPDYPVTDPRLDRARLFVRKDADKVATEWREIGG